MQSFPWEFFIVLLLVIGNGIFAMSEIAIVSAKKIRLQKKAEEGDEKARIALELAKEPNLFLSTVQVGISLVGVLAGAFGGATIAAKIEVYFQEIPLIGQYSKSVSMLIVVAIITYLSLIIGELVPKRLALNNPEKISRRIARPMRLISRITAPLVSFLSFSTELVLKLMGVKKVEETPATEEEIKVMIEEGTRAGMFEKKEQDMVERVFKFADQKVGALLTPRSEIDWLDLGDSLEENLQKICHSVHSRYIVSDGELDEVVGVIRVKDLFDRQLEIEDVDQLDLKSFVDRPLIIPETMPALKVLSIFKQSGNHTAIVIDEYAHVVGLIRPHDVMEYIVGDLAAEEHDENPKIVERKDGSWLIDGLLGFEEFKDFFNIRKLSTKKNTNYQTLGGFIMSYLEMVPKEGDHFTWNGFAIEVVDMDGNRIDKVLVSRE